MITPVVLLYKRWFSLSEWWNSIIDFVFSTFPYPYNRLILIILVAFFILGLLYKTNIHTFIHGSAKKYISYALIIVIVLAVIAIPLYFLYDQNHSLVPPEDKLRVAISPFLVNDPTKEYNSIQTAEEFKNTIEKQNLGIEVILLNADPITNKHDAEYYGRDVGAHIVIYGEINSAIGNREEILYKILPLESLKSKQMIKNETYIHEEFTEKTMYHITQDDTIEIIQTVKENASSVVNTVAAFEKYKHFEFQQAIELFESIKNYQDLEVILFYIGNCFCFDGKPNESLQYFEKAIEINPNYSIAWQNKGTALYVLGDYEKALEVYNKAIELDPQDLVTWNNKGNTLFQLGDYENALGAYEKVVEINPQFERIWYNKGCVFVKVGNLEEAIKAYDRELEMNPQFSEAWHDKGYALAGLGNYEEAIKAYDKAIEINPQFSIAWHNKGCAFAKLENYEEAIKAYDKAIEINPQFSIAWHNKGCAFAKLENYEEAIKAFDKAIEINPQLAESWYSKGCALADSGNYEEAIKAYKKAIEINPQYEEADSVRELLSCN